MEPFNAYIVEGAMALKNHGFGIDVFVRFSFPGNYEIDYFPADNP